MEEFYNFLEDHLDPDVAGALLKRAEELDQDNGLTDGDVVKRHQDVKDWKRNLAKLNAAMIRTMENPPSDYDKKKMEMIRHWFSKE